MFVNRVVEHLEHAVVQAAFVRVADIHAGPLAHRLQTLQFVNFGGVIFLGRTRCRLLFRLQHFRFFRHNKIQKDAFVSVKFQVQKLYENCHFCTMLICGIFRQKTPLVGPGFTRQPDMLWWRKNDGKRVFHAGKRPRTVVRPSRVRESKLALSSRGAVAYSRPVSLHRDQLFAPLKQFFGFTSFRPLQEEIIRDSLAGKDVFAVLPTGGGKSLCFQLPALAATGPHGRRLAAHRADEGPGGRAAGRAAWPRRFLNSSLAAGESRPRLRGLHNGEFRLLYVAPERLMLSGFLEDLKKWNVQPLRH